MSVDLFAVFVYCFIDSNNFKLLYMYNSAVMQYITIFRALQIRTHKTIKMNAF